MIHYLLTISNTLMIIFGCSTIRGKGNLAKFFRLKKYWTVSFLQKYFWTNGWESCFWLHFCSVMMLALLVRVLMRMVFFAVLKQTFTNCGTVFVCTPIIFFNVCIILKFVLIVYFQISKNPESSLSVYVENLFSIIFECQNIPFWHLNDF